MEEAIHNRDFQLFGELTMRVDTLIPNVVILSFGCAYITKNRTATRSTRPA